MIRATCAHCNWTFLSENEAAGKEEVCPKCGHVVSIPLHPAEEAGVAEPLPVASLAGSRGPALIVTTGNEVAGNAIVSCVGIVRGIVVRSPGLGQGFLGGLQQMVGGNIDSYAAVCESAREDAFERMVQHAAEKGADAIIAMRYDATEFT